MQEKEKVKLLEELDPLSLEYLKTLYEIGTNLGMPRPQALGLQKKRAKIHSEIAELFHREDVMQIYTSNNRAYFGYQAVYIQLKDIFSRLDEIVQFDMYEKMDDEAIRSSAWYLTDYLIKMEIKEIEE